MKAMGIYRDRKTFRWYACWWDAEALEVITVSLEDSGTWPLERFEAQFEKKSV